MNRLVACWFNDRHDTQWRRLARVLEHTADRWCPGWEIDVVPIPAPVREYRGSLAYAANTAKLNLWTRAVESLAEGDQIVLVDADTFLTGPLDDAFSTDFDVAITTRPHGASPYPFNAGVVFARAGVRAATFMNAWLAWNRTFYEMPHEHRPYQQRYGGLNQAALGALLERVPDVAPLRIYRLPCQRWNCEDTTWHLFDRARTSIVHVKSALRFAALEAPDDEIDPGLKTLAMLWRREEQAAAVMP